MTDDDAADAAREYRGLPVVRGYGQDGPAWAARGNGDAERNKLRSQLEKLEVLWMRAIMLEMWPW